MQLGIFAKTFPGDDPATVLMAVKAAGFSTAHYNMSCSGLASLPQSIPEPASILLASTASDLQVFLCGLSATFNMIHPDKAERDRGFAALEHLASVAATLGIPILSLCTGTQDAQDMWRHHPDNASKDSWRELLDSMARAIAIAERHGILLGIEPETANVVSSTQLARRCLDELQSDRVKIICDPANLIDHGSTADFNAAIDDAIDLLAQDILMAHAKDKLSDGKVVPAGSGVIDFAYFFRRLAAISFQGAVVTHGLAAADAPAAHAALMRAAHHSGVELA